MPTSIICILLLSFRSVRSAFSFNSKFFLVWSFFLFRLIPVLFLAGNVCLAFSCISYIWEYSAFVRCHFVRLGMFALLLSKYEMRCNGIHFTYIDNLMHFQFCFKSKGQCQTFTYQVKLRKLHNSLIFLVVAQTVNRILRTFLSEKWLTFQRARKIAETIRSIPTHSTKYSMLLRKSASEALGKQRKKSIFKSHSEDIIFKIP